MPENLVYGWEHYVEHNHLEYKERRAVYCKLKKI